MRLMTRRGRNSDGSEGQQTARLFLRIKRRWSVRCREMSACVTLLHCLVFQRRCLCACEKKQVKGHLAQGQKSHLVIWCSQTVCQAREDGTSAAADATTSAKLVMHYYSSAASLIHHSALSCDALICQPFAPALLVFVLRQAFHLSWSSDDRTASSQRDGRRNVCVRQIDSSAEACSPLCRRTLLQSRMPENNKHLKNATGTHECETGVDFRRHLLAGAKGADMRGGQEEKRREKRDSRVAARRLKACRHTQQPKTSFSSSSSPPLSSSRLYFTSSARPVFGFIRRVIKRSLSLSCQDVRSAA